MIFFLTGEFQFVYVQVALQSKNSTALQIFKKQLELATTGGDNRECNCRNTASGYKQSERK
jgi:hypothetical protein